MADRLLPIARRNAKSSSIPMPFNRIHPILSFIYAPNLIPDLTLFCRSPVPQTAYSLTACPADCFSDHITKSAPRLYKIFRADLIEFCPDPRNIHTQRIVINENLVVPQPIDQFRSGHNLPLILK